MMVIPIVIGALGTISKSLKSVLEYFEIRGRIKTTQTTALSRSTRLRKRVLEIWRDLLLLRRLSAQSVVAVEYTDCTSAEV